MRLVTIRYLVPVYCTVDLDAKKAPGDDWYPDDAVTRVFQADESIFMSDERDVLKRYTEGSCITDAVEADPEDQADPMLLSQDEQEKAMEIANSTAWPIWEN